MPPESQQDASYPEFRGMMPILPTAITSDGLLDEASQRRAVQYCLQCGAVAIGHFGIASEYHKLTPDQRSALATMIVDEVDGHVPVFLGVTAPTAETSSRFAREAEERGADIIMSSLPDGEKSTPESAFEFYADLAEAISLPIIIQDTPATTEILSAELVARMVREIPQVHYVKAEGKNFIGKTARLLELSQGKMAVIGGAGGKHLIHLLRLGVQAFMTGTEALDLHGSAVTKYLQGEHETATRIYFEQIVPYLEFYLDYPEELLKWMLRERGILDSARVLDPPAAPPMGDVERNELRWVLQRIGWNKQWPDIP